MHITRGNFNGGLLGLAAHRLELEKVQAGCVQLQNFFPLASGQLVARGSSSIVAPMPEGSRLVPFNFSTSTSFVLELGDRYLKVWNETGEVPLQTPVATPWDLAAVWRLQFFQINDIVYFAEGSTPPQKLERLANTNWRLSQVWGDLTAANLTIVPGEPGVMQVEAWDWSGWVMGATTEMFDFIGSTTPDGALFGRPQKAPTSIATATQSSLPASSRKEIRRLSGVFKATVTGSHTFSVNANDDNAGLDKFHFQAGSLSAIRAADGGAASITVSLALGQEIELAAVLGNATGSSSLALKASWPGRALNFLPAANIRKPDQQTTHGLRRAGVSYPPLLDENANTQITVAASALQGAITLTAAGGDVFLPGHAGAFFQLAHRRQQTFVEFLATKTGSGTTWPFAGATAELRVLGRWSATSYGLFSADVILERRPLGSSVWETEKSWRIQKDTQIAVEGEETVLTELRIRLVNGTAQEASAAAAPRFVLQAADSKLAGLVRIVSVISPREATAEVVADLVSSDPTWMWTRGAFSAADGFPSAIGGHEQRLWLGGTKTAPQRLHGSQIADIENFRRTLFEDGGISLELAAGEAHRVVWLASFNDALLIGTTAEEWLLTRLSEEQSLTPFSFRASRLSKYGSAAISPVLLGESLCYVALDGKRIRRLVWEGGRYLNADLTTLYPEVGGSGIRQLAAAHSPVTVLLAITGNGELFACSVDMDQAVVAWAKWQYPSASLSAAAIYAPGGMEVFVLGGGVMGLQRQPLIWMQPWVSTEGTKQLDAFEIVSGSASWDSPRDIFDATGLRLATGVTSWTGEGYAGLVIEGRLQPTLPLLQGAKGSPRMQNHRISRASCDGLDCRIAGQPKTASGEWATIPARSQRLEMPEFLFEGASGAVTAVHFAIDIYGD